MSAGEPDPEYDVARLAARIDDALRGRAARDPLTLGLYTTDASNYRVRPDMVVVPHDGRRPRDSAHAGPGGRGTRR